MATTFVVVCRRSECAEKFINYIRNPFSHNNFHVARYALWLALFDQQDVVVVAAQ